MFWAMPICVQVPFRSPLTVTADCHGAQAFERQRNSRYGQARAKAVLFDVRL